MVCGPTLLDQVVFCGVSRHYINRELGNLFTDSGFVDENCDLSSLVSSNPVAAAGWWPELIIGLGY